MNTSFKAAVVIGVLSLCGTAPSALAQVKENTHEVTVFAGGFFGGELVDGKINGETPELDDAFLGGLRYEYNTTDRWGIEVSLGYSNPKLKNVEGPENKAKLWISDFNVIYHFRHDKRLVPYVTAGLGYAHAKLDRPLSDGTVQIEGDGGVTFNAGLGVKYFATEHLVLRAEGRYRRMTQLVDPLDKGMNTAEVTGGVAWRF